MAKVTYPLISVVITTFNSERTLEKTLSSIRNQSYPQNKIEILIVDGGSRDKTLEIAKKYECKITKRSGDITSRKQFGLIKSSGKYLVYIDSDESFENIESLELKNSIFLKNSSIKSVISEGCKSPSKGSFINDYINQYGDPFSFFIYREAKNSENLIKTWKRKYKILYEDINYIIFDFQVDQSSLIELWAGGCMIDLEYVKKTFPEIKKNLQLIPLLFYLLKGNQKLIAVTKNDAVFHDSADSLDEYLTKLSSRIKNNVFKTDLGLGGYSGREKFQNSVLNFQKYFFIPYALLLLPVSLDTLYLIITQKKFSYFIHLPLTVYTAILTFCFLVLKNLGYKPKKIYYGYL